MTSTTPYNLRRMAGEYVTTTLPQQTLEAVTALSADITAAVEEGVSTFSSAPSVATVSVGMAALLYFVGKSASSYLSRRRSKTRSLETLADCSP